MIGSFTVDKETGVVTFTPTDKSYSGDVVRLKVLALMQMELQLKQHTHRRLLQLFQLPKMQHRLISKVPPKQVKPTLKKVIQNPIDEDTPAAPSKMVN